MKMLKVVGNNSCQKIYLHGDIKNPEPDTVVIKFPGGHVEVSRCTDNTYWAHIAVTKRDDYDDNGDITPEGKFLNGRIDFEDKPVMSFPSESNHIAIRIGLK